LHISQQKYQLEKATESQSHLSLNLICLLVVDTGCEYRKVGVMICKEPLKKLILCLQKKMPITKLILKMQQVTVGSDV
jgi:hypothetical protein